MFPPLRLREALTLGGLTPKELALRTWRKMNEHEIMTRASGVSFYAMLAVVPFLAIILTLAVQLLPDLTGFTGAKGVGDMTVAKLESTLRSLLPRDAYAIFADEIAGIQKQPPVGLLSLGLIISLWTSSSLFLAIIDSLNRIDGVIESRSFLKLRLVGVGMTVIQAGILVGSLLIILAWGSILRWMGLTGSLAAVATAIQWAVLFLMVLMSFALTFYVGPDAESHWEWITPGSLVGTACFLLASLGFRVYIQNWTNYNRTYGSLGGVMVLLFWFWISATVLLTAAQVNKVIEEASPPRQELRPEDRPRRRPGPRPRRARVEVRGRGRQEPPADTLRDNQRRVIRRCRRGTPILQLNEEFIGVPRRHRRMTRLSP